MSYLKDPVFRSVEHIRAPGAVAQHLAAAWTDWAGEVPDDVAVCTEKTLYEPFEGAAVTAEAAVVPKNAHGEAVMLDLLLAVYPDADAHAAAVLTARSQDFDKCVGPPFFTIPSCHTVVWTAPNGPEPRPFWGAESFCLPASRAAQPYTGGCEGLPSRFVRPSTAGLPVGESRANRGAHLFSGGPEVGKSTPSEANHRLMAAAQSGGLLSFEVPQLMEKQPERDVIVLREPDGHRFAGHLREPFRKPFEMVGRALASLHDAAIQPETSQRPEALLDAGVRAAQRIVRALPELETTTSGVIGALLSTRLPQSAADFGPVHGRLDGDRIVLQGTTVGICGWEGLTSGHVYQDLAAVIAHAVEESAACSTATSVTRACIRALIQSYAQARGSALSRAALYWHLALAMLLRAGEISLRRLMDGWHRCLSVLVCEADGLLTDNSRYIRGC